jgi:integrase
VKEREQLREELHQAQKMEAVGQLTGGLAHDLNNLLAGISGSLELMQRRIEQGRIDDLNRYITAALGASKRAAALTHRLLAFSRRLPLYVEPTDIGRLVVGLEELVCRTVGPEIAVEVVTAGVKQQLAAVRMMFNWLITGQIAPVNPAAAVRGPKLVVTTGKTPVLDGKEWHKLIDSIPTETVRDRALIATLTYSFARITAALRMKVEDLRPKGAGWQIQLHEKGGKKHKMPCHHALAEMLAYVAAAGIAEDRKGWLFRTSPRHGATVLTEQPMSHLAGFDIGERVRRVSTDTFLEPAHKILVLAALHGRPCLIIAGRGFEGQERCGGNAGQLASIEVVKLNQRHGDLGARAHDHVVPVALGVLQQRGQGAIEIGRGAVAAEGLFLARRVRPCEVKADRSDTRKSVDHHQHFCTFDAALSHTAPCFYSDWEITPEFRT